MEVKKLAHEADIRASPATFDPVDAVAGVEFGGEDAGESLDARSPGVDERSVDIE